MFMHAVIAIKKPEDRYQNTIVVGNATMYRILCVKFSNKNKLPRKPQMSDATLIQ